MITIAFEPLILICMMSSNSGAVVGDNIPGRTIIGCNNVIGHHAVIGIKCQDMKFKVAGLYGISRGCLRFLH